MSIIKPLFVAADPAPSQVGSETLVWENLENLVGDTASEAAMFSGGIENTRKAVLAFDTPFHAPPTIRFGVGVRVRAKVDTGVATMYVQLAEAGSPPTPLGSPQSVNLETSGYTGHDFGLPGDDWEIEVGRSDIESLRVLVWVANTDASNLEFYIDRIALSLYPIEQSDPSPANVRAFGAVGDGVADDTEAIQAAIDAALESTWSGQYSGVYFPPGVYLVTDTLHVPWAEGWRMWGAGGSVTGGASGHAPYQRGAMIVAAGLAPSGLTWTDEEWDDATNYTTDQVVMHDPSGTDADHSLSFWRATANNSNSEPGLSNSDWELVPAKPILNIEGCSGFAVKDLAFRGVELGSTPDPNDYAPVGIRVQNVPGTGTGMCLFERVSIDRCQVAFDAGGRDEGDTAHDENNAADMTFVRCSFTHNRTGFRCSHDQAVDFGFFGQVTTACRRAFWAYKGGNICAYQWSGGNVETLLQVKNGGAVAAHVFDGCFVDGYQNSTVTASHRTVLFKGTSPTTVRATFRDVWINVGQLAVEGDARFQLAPGNNVRIDGGHNLAGPDPNLSTGEGFLFELSGIFGGWPGSTFLARHCHIPNDPTLVVGSVGEGAEFRIRDCFVAAIGTAGNGFVEDYGRRA